MTSVVRKVALVGTLALLAGAAQASYATTAGTFTSFFGLQTGVQTNAVDAKAEFMGDTAKAIAGTETFSAIQTTGIGTFRSGSTALNADISCVVTDPEFGTFAACERTTDSPDGDGRRDTTGDTAHAFLRSSVMHSAPIVFTFDTAISAFGMYATDVGDFGGDLTYELRNADGQVVRSGTVASGGQPDDSLLFFGFYDSGASYKSITFLNSNVADVFGIDDVMAGYFCPVGSTLPGCNNTGGGGGGGGGTTPEPATWLLALGALGAAASRRRNRT